MTMMGESHLVVQTSTLHDMLHKVVVWVLDGGRPLVGCLMIVFRMVRWLDRAVGRNAVRSSFWKARISTYAISCN